MILIIRINMKVSFDFDGTILINSHTLTDIKQDNENTRRNRTVG